MQLRRRIIWDGALKTEPVKTGEPVTAKRKTSYQAPKSSPKPVAASAPMQVGSGQSKPDSKNGHKVEFIRKMNEDEKKAIRRWWLNKDGCCDWDSVVEFKSKRLSEEIAIFQVVGFITSLHKKLAKGTITGIDISKYNAHRESRGQTTLKVDLPEKVSPKFTTLPKKKATTRKKKYTA